MTQISARRIDGEMQNQASAPYAASACLHQLFEAQAERAPEALAVEHGSLQLTYRQLNTKANRLARYLRSLGAGPNGPVAICLSSSPEFAIAVLAILKAGGACVPLDPNYPQQRLNFMLSDVQAAVLLTQPGLLQGALPASTKTIYFDSLKSVLDGDTDDRNLEAVTAPGSTAYIIYTSGSTGKPKGVLLGHCGLVNHALASIDLYGLTSRDRTLQFSSISFDIAIEEIFPTWAAGGSVIFKPNGFSLGFAEFIVSIRELGITVLDLPTAYWHEWTNFLHENPQASLPGDLRLVIVGGEKVSAAILERWRARTGDTIRWINTYGPSEASVIASAYEPCGSSDAPLTAVPIGRPIANTRIYLLDHDRNPVPMGSPGELYIGGTGVALGYLNRPELTAEKFVHDPFSEDAQERMYRTGDMARYRSDGEIEFLGRQDDQVKIRGFRVEPGEIEEVIARHSAVREAAVMAQEDELGSKRLVAYVVFARQPSSNSDELRSYLRDRLPDYMVPSELVSLDAMPMTPNGKIDRQALLNRAASRSESALTFASGDNLESKIIAIWQDLLGRRVELQDNFFELGGHSLLAARMMHRLGQALGRTLPLALLLQSPTLEQLAEALGEDSVSDHWSSVVAIQPQGTRPPFFCIHGVGGNVVGFRDLGRHMGPTHPFYGLQARGLDGSQPSLSSVEEMALQYLYEIRGVQPEGPYFLGGYSFGGLVAYEMARLLHAKGEQVALLALFDTAPGNLKPATSSLLKKLAKPSAKFLFSELPRSMRKGIRRRWRGLRTPQVLKNVFYANTRAAQQYVLKSYEGKVTLFRATEKSLRTAENPYAAWHDLALGGLEFQDIPGDHFGVLVEPQVAVFAERLQMCIDAADTTSLRGEIRHPMEKIVV